MHKILQILGLILIGILFSIGAIFIFYNSSNDESKIIYSIIIGYASYLSLLFFGEKNIISKKLIKLIWNILFITVKRTIISNFLIIIIITLLSYPIKEQYDIRKHNVIINVKNDTKGIIEANDTIRVYNLRSKKITAILIDKDGIGLTKLSTPAIIQLQYNEYLSPKLKVSKEELSEIIIDVSKIDILWEKLKVKNKTPELSIYKLPKAYIKKFSKKNKYNINDDSISKLKAYTNHGIEPIEGFYLKNGYINNYNNVFNIPNCVSYKIYGTFNKYNRPPFQFDRDLNSAKSNDYRNSGYHRGHLVSNYDMSFIGESAVKDGSLMSAIAPQTKYINLNTWFTLENRARDLLKTNSDTIFISAGTLFLQQDEELNIEFSTIGENKVAVPSHFFRIISKNVNGVIKATAFLIPNENDVDGVYSDYIVTIDYIEEKSGLNFFSDLNVDTQDILESSTFNILKIDE